jgi:uncharacterized protein YceH (UPF0502 family)
VPLNSLWLNPDQVAVFQGYILSLWGMGTDCKAWEHKISKCSFASHPTVYLSVHTAHVLGMLVVRGVRTWGEISFWCQAV